MLLRLWTANWTKVIGLIFSLGCGGSLRAANTSDSQRIGTTVQTAGSSRGTPIKLTWSIVPDGISLPSTFTNPATNPNPTSRLIVALDDRFGVPAGDRTAGDLTGRIWFSIFEEMFANYSRKTGLDYSYVGDDGAGFPSANGGVGVRGDIRIAGTALSNALGYNGIPNGGTAPDMVLNSSFAFTTANLKLVSGHEHAHGLGLGHVEVAGNCALSVVCDSGGNSNGPQFDDLLALHRKYGDALEKAGGNEIQANAFSLGTLESGQILGVGLDADDLSITAAEDDFVSIDGSDDVDFYRFTLSRSSMVLIELEPRGPAYSYLPEGGAAVTLNTRAQSNLTLRVLSGMGGLLHDVNVTGLGQSEVLTTGVLAAGTYSVRVAGTENKAQMYALRVSIPDSDGDGVSDSGELADGRNPLSATDLAFEFESIGDVEGWTGDQLVSSLSVTDGKLKGTTVTVDGKVVQTGLGFAGSAVNHLAVRMKAAASGTVELFWGTAAANNFSGTRRLGSAYVGPDWKVVIFDLSGVADWSAQTITRLRIDPITSAGAAFEIDWIRASDGDFDDDGLADELESSDDLDGDGLVNWRDRDSDGDGTGDGQEVVVGRNALDPSDLGFEFETEGDFEGWGGANNMINLLVSGGRVLGQAVTEDPNFRVQGLRFPGTACPEIEVRLKASANREVEIFWGVVGQDFFAAARRLVVNYTGNGEWQLVRFAPNWSGEIVTRLRIDPIRQAGADFEIDWIRAVGGDADGDGMPDSYEIANGLNPGSGLDRNLDLDGDGDSNYLEFLAGTAANDSRQRFVVTPVGGADFKAQVLGKAGRIYRLLRLVDESPSWTVVAETGPLTVDAILVLGDDHGGPSGIYEVEIFRE